MEEGQLFTCFASQTLQQTSLLSFQKNFPSVVHFYTNRWSMLVLSEPSQGGKMWKKKGEVVQLWCDLSTQENTVCVWHGKHTQWKESLLFTSGNSKHFFVCVQAHRKTFGYSRLGLRPKQRSCLGEHCLLNEWSSICPLDRVIYPPLYWIACALSGCSVKSSTGIVLSYLPSRLSNGLLRREHPLNTSQRKLF